MLDKLTFGNLVAVVGLIGVVFALASWNEAVKQTSLEIRHAKDNSVVQAWQTLAARSPGNSGKVEAIQILASGNTPLTGIDISCEAMRGGWDAPNKSCTRLTYLAGVRLNFPDRNIDLSYSNLSGVDLSGGDLTSSILRNVSFDGSLLQDTNLNDTQVVFSTLRNVFAENSKFHRAHISFSELNGSTFSEAEMIHVQFNNVDATDVDFVGAKFVGAAFDNVNISGAIFCAEGIGCANGLDQAQMSGTWSWDDNLPQFVDGDAFLDLHTEYICNSNQKMNERQIWVGVMPTDCTRQKSST